MEDTIPRYRISAVGHHVIWCIGTSRNIYTTAHEIPQVEGYLRWRDTIPRYRMSASSTSSGWEDICSASAALYATTPDHEIPQIEGYHPTARVSGGRYTPPAGREDVCTVQLALYAHRTHPIHRYHFLYNRW